VLLLIRFAPSSISSDFLFNPGTSSNCSYVSLHTLYLMFSAFSILLEFCFCSMFTESLLKTFCTPPAVPLSASLSFSSLIEVLLSIRLMPSGIFGLLSSHQARSPDSCFLILYLGLNLMLAFSSFISDPVSVSRFPSKTLTSSNAPIFFTSTPSFSDLLKDWVLPVLCWHTDLLVSCFPLNKFVTGAKARIRNDFDSSVLDGFGLTGGLGCLSADTDNSSLLEFFIAAVTDIC